MSGWPATLFEAAERIAHQELGGGPGTLYQLAQGAAKLGLRDEAMRLADSLAQGGNDWLGELAQVRAALGDRAAVDEIRARALGDDAASLREHAGALAVSYQLLGEDTEADRVIADIDDAEARWTERAVLTHAAVAARRPARAASLAREIAALPLPPGGGLSAVLTLAAAAGDRGTAAEVAPAAERAAATLREESRDEALTSVARLWLAANRPEDALRIARPIAKRASRDFNSVWYADLARVLHDAGAEEAGTELFERHVRWLEDERSATNSARAALALARWGRTSDAESMLAKAEAQLKAGGGAAPSDAARRALIDAYLALDDIPGAIRVAAELSDARDKVKALLAIAVHGHEHGVRSTPDITAALRESGLTPGKRR